MKRVALALLIALLPGGAFAHADLSEANPADGAELTEAPATVSIRYSEPLELAFSTIRVVDEAGTTIGTGPPAHADGDRHTLSVTLPALEPGRYTVEWGAASVDTHRTQGRYSFTVVP